MDRSRKVLIVEDETLTALALSAYLSDLGCEVLDLSATGEEAVQTARANKPDIVFMDVNLQGKMDGIEAAGIIAQGGPISIIFITGYSNKSVHDRAAAQSPTAYLIKPFDFSVIDKILEAIV